MPATVENWQGRMRRQLRLTTLTGKYSFLDSETQGGTCALNANINDPEAHALLGLHQHRNNHLLRRIYVSVQLLLLQGYNTRVSCLVRFYNPCHRSLPVENRQ